MDRSVGLHAHGGPHPGGSWALYHLPLRVRRWDGSGVGAECDSGQPHRLPAGPVDPDRDGNPAATSDTTANEHAEAVVLRGGDADTGDVVRPEISDSSDSADGDCDGGDPLVFDGGC